ncbi:hypothetical protein [Halomicronema sp. CCY15110]|uniref:hypothetical protein n=1 Tax=Halomicronema sp. CCY15110 TaxID=2767773 RepID=UPI00194DE37E|nr:hypothetical protein [Halomicronema sp. CCY15110]
MPLTPGSRPGPLRRSGQSLAPAIWSAPYPTAIGCRSPRVMVMAFEGEVRAGHLAD